MVSATENNVPWCRVAADKSVFAVKVLGSKLYKRIELTIKNQRRKIVEKEQVLDNGKSYSRPSLCSTFAFA